jgi:predicted 3-demethylubiquinone-9 3-methyltransferase (glyoxalase superfamily)
MTQVSQAHVSGTRRDGSRDELPAVWLEPPLRSIFSLFVTAETQDEIDDLWAKLTNGGEPGQCGWLKDRYGLSWQIVPPVLGELLGDPDPDKSSRVMQAMLGMSKIDIAALRAAHDAE